MFSYDFGHVVAVSIGWIRIVPGEISRITPKTSTISSISCERNSWQQSPESILEQGAHREPWGSCYWSTRRKQNVIGGVTRHEFIEQCGSNVCIQPRDKACAWTHEACGDVLEARQTAVGVVSPESVRHHSLPRVVDVAECESVIIRQIVVDAYKFFPPCSGF